jgi:hypothetical protein
MSKKKDLNKVESKKTNKEIQNDAKAKPRARENEKEIHTQRFLQK